MHRAPALFLYLSLLLTSLPLAAEDTVLSWTVDKHIEPTYHSVYSALERHHFVVVFEADIQKNISRFSERWGDDYNRNKLTGIRSMVFCNGWYANQVSNLDPNMLAMCPLRLSLYEKAGKTTVVFVRPSVVARGSAARKIAVELENDVREAIEQGLAIR